MITSEIIEENGGILTLEWNTKVFSGEYTWRQALEKCSKGMFLDKELWRLPTIEELISLIDSEQMDLSEKQLWSRESVVGNYAFARVIGDNKSIVATDKKHFKNVIAVRIN